MLTSEKIIIESDGDLEIVATIIAGYDFMNNLVLQYYCEDYETDCKNPNYVAVVDKEDVEIMAKHLDVRAIDLPQVLYNKFGDSTGVSTLSDVEYVFKDMLDFIIGCGAQYRFTNSSDTN